MNVLIAISNSNTLRKYELQTCLKLLLLLNNYEVLSARNSNYARRLNHFTFLYLVRSVSWRRRRRRILKSKLNSRKLLKKEATKIRNKVRFRFTTRHHHPLFFFLSFSLSFFLFRLSVYFSLSFFFVCLSISLFTRASNVSF